MLEIRNFIDKIFNNIESQTITLYKEEAIKKLESIYKKHVKNGYTEYKALGLIFTKYNSIEDIEDLMGYTPFEKNNAKEQKIKLKDAKKKVKHLHSYVFLFIFSIIEILLMIYWSLYQGNINFLIYTIPFVFISILSIIKTRKYEVLVSNFIVEPNAKIRKYFREYYDKITKKTINSLAFSFALIFLFLCSAYVSLGINGANKYYFTLQTLFYLSNLFLLFTFFIKNIVIKKKFVDKFIRQEKIDNFNKHFKKILICSLLYWIIISIVTIIFFSREAFLIYFVAVSFYFILIVFYDYTLRQYITFKNINYNKKRIMFGIICFASVVLFNYMQRDNYLLQPYISSVSSVEYEKDEISYNDYNGVYTIKTNKEDFKVLQLTDIHLGGSLYTYTKDLKALDAIRRLIKYTKPDFIVVTGDVAFPVGLGSLSFNNHTPIIQFANFMRNIGIPWAFTYGNHDTEVYATSTSDEINEIFKSLSYNSSKTLLFPYVQPNISGRNNQMIELRDQDNNLREVFFLLDSNSYRFNMPNDYDYIHDDQVEWYAEQIKKVNEEANRIVPSMIFIHIPIEEYKTAYDLYKLGSNEVKYYFGEIGEKNEAICISNEESNLFEKALELQSTKAIFAGHDHYNNISLEYKGIRLTYGMSIDYLAMPGIENDYKQRGATLITIKQNDDFIIEQVPLEFLDYNFQY